MVLPCTCTHRAQDELHGHGQRVHNPLAKSPGSWRCSVCGRVSERKEKPKEAQPDEKH